MTAVWILLAAAGLLAVGRSFVGALHTLDTARTPSWVPLDEFIAMHRAPTLGERVVEPLYDRVLEEMFAAPAADVWEDGCEPGRRGER